MIQNKIDTLIADVEGCIIPTQSAKSWQRDDLLQLKHYNFLNDDSLFPSITMCTGREKGFVEALSNFIGCKTPAVFENGCGLFIPSENVRKNTLFHPKLENLEKVKKERSKIKNAIVNYNKLSSFDVTRAHGKEVLLSYYPPAGLEIQKFHQLIEELLEEIDSKFQVVHSVHTLDIFPKGIDKRAGVSWLLDRGNQSGLGNIAAIGDSKGDLPFLNYDKVEFSAAPANAVPEVKRVVDYVSSKKEIRGVVDIVQRIKKLNSKV